MKTPKEFFEAKYPYHTRILKQWAIDLLEAYAQQFQQDKPTELRDELQIVKKAFEAGVVYAKGKRGETSLWTDYILKGFYDFIRPYLVNSANVCTTKDLTDSERKR